MVRHPTRPTGPAAIRARPRLGHARPQPDAHPRHGDVYGVACSTAGHLPTCDTFRPDLPANAENAADGDGTRRARRSSCWRLASTCCWGNHSLTRPDFGEVLRPNPASCGRTTSARRRARESGPVDTYAWPGGGHQPARCRLREEHVLIPSRSPTNSSPRRAHADRAGGPPCRGEKVAFARYVADGLRRWWAPTPTQRQTRGCCPGTAYVTDLGMSGPDSVIGVRARSSSTGSGAEHPPALRNRRGRRASRARPSWPMRRRPRAQTRDVRAAAVGSSPMRVISVVGNRPCSSKPHCSAAPCSARRNPGAHRQITTRRWPMIFDELDIRARPCPASAPESVGAARRNARRARNGDHGRSA